MTAKCGPKRGELGVRLDSTETGLVMPSEVPSQKKKPRASCEARVENGTGRYAANCRGLMAAANYFEHGVVAVLLSKEEAGSISRIGSSV